MNESGFPLSSPAAMPAFTSLHPKVIHLWRLSRILSSLMILTLALIGIWFLTARGIITAENSGIAFGLLLFVLGAIALFLPPVAYRNWGYRLNERVLEIRRGILTKSRILVPLTRVQHVDLERGPVERHLGLATLVIYTAGTEHAEQMIPGLLESSAIALRDHLINLGIDHG
ncbi:MAG: PH domain-containing protein [Verrucomicrobiota bacterium]